MLYSLFLLIGLKRLRGIKYKNHISWIKSGKLVIGTHTWLIREVKQAQLIGLKGIKYKNHISWIESAKGGNRNSY